VQVAGIAGRRWSSEEGRAATIELLEGPSHPTAIVASSVELALGALFVCRERGIAIPGDIALAAFDDAYFAELLEPSLTAIAYDPAEVGKVAASLLVEAIEADEPIRRDVSMPVRLVTRRSCGCGT
jgi:LacI family transcriptional regulator